MSRAEHSPEAQRQAALEAALAHLERNYDSLNAVVVEQGRILVRLQKRLEQMNETFKMQDLDQPSAHNVKPPHYSA